MTSEAQISANRENAQLSTGANDTSKTRFNAVKHGLCAKGFLNEREIIEFNEMFQELIEELEPKGVIELRLVENIALAVWERQKVIIKDFAYEHNESLNMQIKKIDSSPFSNLGFGITEKDSKKKEELENNKKTLILPNELLMRYKNEADNRFYKALRIWKEFVHK